MGDKSKIEWTDATWNPIVGCSVVSPGCRDCYAMPMARRIELMSDGWHSKGAGHQVVNSSHYAGTTKLVNGKPVWTGNLALAPYRILTAPLRWKKPRTIFVNSMGDLFHEDCPDEWIDQVFAVMALAPQHTFQVLTKRAARMHAYLTSMRGSDVIPSPAPAILDEARKIQPLWNLTQWPLPNVWLGVSTEDQKRANERIPDLLHTPAAVRFVSAEPLLGPIDVRKWTPDCYECGASCGLRLSGRPDAERCLDCGEICTGDTEPVLSEGCPKCGGELEPVCPDCGHYMVYQHPDTPMIDWVIAGGESGPNARPMHPDWARSLRDQCAAAGVPFFFKQHGEWAPCPDASDWPYDPDYHRTTWFNEPDCVRPLEEGWSDKYHTGHCRAQDPILLKPYGGELFNTPEFLDQVRRCPQAKCGESGKCLGNDRRQAVRRVGKRAAGRLLDGREHNGMPEVRR